MRLGSIEWSYWGVTGGRFLDSIRKVPGTFRVLLGAPGSEEWSSREEGNI